MKEKKNSNYATYKLGKITAPNAVQKDEPKSKKISASTDLRSGGRK